MVFMVNGSGRMPSLPSRWDSGFDGRLRTRYGTARSPELQLSVRSQVLGEGIAAAKVRGPGSPPASPIAHIRRVLQASAILLVSLGGFADPNSTLTLGVSARSIEVTEVRPGAEVVIAGFYQDAKGYHSALGHIYRKIADEDSDRILSFDFGRAIPPRSVWFVIDSLSGDVAYATPSGYEPRVRELPAGTLRRDDDDVLELSRRSVRILLLRPGRGVWQAAVEQGGLRDEDGANDGRIRISLRNLKSFNDAPAAPQTLAPSDVLVIVDPYTLEFFVTRIGA